MSKLQEYIEAVDKVCKRMCDEYCKWPNEPIPEGKEEGWLQEDEDSPCKSCPLIEVF